MKNSKKGPVSFSHSHNGGLENTSHFLDEYPQFFPDLLGWGFSNAEFTCSLHFRLP
jgi:hypothetical protein